MSSGKKPRGLDQASQPRPPVGPLSTVECTPVAEALQTAPMGGFLRVVVLEQPRCRRTRVTLVRLIGMDPGVQRALRRAARKRRLYTETRRRGGRDWVNRGPCARFVQVRPGIVFVFRNAATLWPDLRAVSGVVGVLRTNKRVEVTRHV